MPGIYGRKGGLMGFTSEPFSVRGEGGPYSLCWVEKKNSKGSHEGREKKLNLGAQKRGFDHEPKGKGGEDILYVGEKRGERPLGRETGVSIS